MRLLTAVAQWVDTPDIHYYVAGSIPAATPTYGSNKIKNVPIKINP
jgi:hypothetical protein